MSQALTKSPKHCGNKQGLNIGKLYKKLFLSSHSKTPISTSSTSQAATFSTPLFSSLCFPRTQTRKLGFTTTSLKCLPVAPSFGYEVGRDQTAGRLVLNLKVIGRLRWKVGLGSPGSTE
ncbi:hypothetical protein L3X38_011516 [Prunus dulcis]|uniref:Uncharacterized protein n=1 Tax=Prunus dulcis TaxID=3755 RepID=A0AAD4WHI8_PRUDU|nr:hypothetical protein L3X38_011516 [Prunus dulcis]